MNLKIIIKSLIIYIITNIILIFPAILVLGVISLGAPIILLGILMFVYCLINGIVIIFATEIRKIYIIICIILPISFPILVFIFQMLIYGY